MVTFGIITTVSKTQKQIFSQITIGVLRVCWLFVLLGFFNYSSSSVSLLYL